MRIVLLAFALLVSSSVPSFAQIYVDHTTYQPPSGESAAAFFARIRPGDPVVELHGYVWAHDGVRWSQVPAGEPEPGTPEPDGPCARFNAYTASPELILTCAPRPLRPISTLTGESFVFEVGGVYRLPFGSYRLLVLGIAPDVGSPRRVITGRVLRSSGTLAIGALAAFFEDASGGWCPLMPDEER
jgi:hypothetical protein